MAKLEHPDLNPLLPNPYEPEEQSPEQAMATFESLSKTWHPPSAD